MVTVNGVVEYFSNMVRLAVVMCDGSLRRLEVIFGVNNKDRIDCRSPFFIRLSSVSYVFINVDD